MKKVNYNKNLGLLMACLSLLVFGACSLYQNGGITYTSIVSSIPRVVPAVVIMYGLGWLIGSMLKFSKNIKKDVGYTNTLLEEIMKEEGLDNIDKENPIELTNAEQMELTDLQPESKE